MEERFSERHGFERDPEITVREDAPKSLRNEIVNLALSSVLHVSTILATVERVVRGTALRRTGLRNQRMAEIAQQYLSNCEWFYVYDVIEKLHQELLNDRRKNSGLLKDIVMPDLIVFEPDASKRMPAREVPLLRADDFENAINTYFRRYGIGWQLIDGKIEYRSDEVFERTRHTALQAVEEAGSDVARRELAEAFDDLSKRPADLTGAITHSIAALESVAKEVSGDANATLGEIIKDKRGMFPKPLDQGIEKIWGYASQYGRHVSEGKPPTSDEAELVVSVSATGAAYLLRKAGLVG